MLITLVLMLLFASRMPRLLSFPMDVDELWTAWQSIGTLDRVLAWVPYDWPPLHYVVVWAWQSLTSPHPLILRLLSTFLLLVGAAWMYRTAYRLTGSHWSAAVGMAAYSSFGFILYASVLVRGYGLLYALMPLLLWLVLRYFDRPSTARAALVGICLATMFYTHLSIAVSFPFVGVVTAVLFTRHLWRWWLPGILALALAVPLIIQQMPLLISRAPAVQTVQTPPYFQALGNWYGMFLGDAAFIWVPLILIAVILVIVRQPRLGFALMIWCLAPALVLLLNSSLGFFTQRHLAWTGVGLALLLAAGAKALPRTAAVGSLLVMLVLSWVPFPADRYIWGDTKPNIEVFKWLREQWRSGDVVYIDPTTSPVPPETWDYFAAVYFPDGLPIVTSPEGYRRVWYAAVDGWNLPETRQKLEVGRVARQFVGPWNFLVRLYEAPPDPVGIVFEDGPRFHGFEQVGANTPGYLISHEDETLRLRLWWSTDQPLSADYSIVVQLLDQNGALVSQTADRTGSAAVPRETSQWRTEQFYIEELILPIPKHQWLGAPSTVTYQLVLTVYQWWDGQRLTAPGVNGDNLLPLGPLHVTAW